nr:hypothetical protein [Duganella aceris]
MMAAPHAAGGKRILAALEHGPRPASKPLRASGWTIDGWTIGLGLLLLLMLVVAWMMHGKTITPATFKYDGGERRHAALQRVASPAAPAAAEQPAIIVNEERRDAESAMQPTPPPSPQPWHKPMPPGVAVVARGAQPAATSTPAATTRDTAGPAAAAASATRDTDIALLAALVAHANKPTVTVAERSRDVVERKEGDSTAELLARCRQLGLIEGMLCRSRICAERWDADAACRAPAH